MATATTPVSVACPACLAIGATYVGENAEVGLVRCPACTLVFSHPPPTARVRQKYLVEYDLAEQFGSMEPRKGALFAQRLRRLPQPRPGFDRLCDVGCGDGQFLMLAAERGWQPSGIEMNPPAARRAAQRGPRVWQGTLETLDDLPWKAFDLVTCWDVLEHTPDPRRFGERLVRLMAPGALLVVTTLNIDSLAYRWFGTRWSMVGEDHFTYWSRRSIAVFFQSLGVRIEEVRTFGLGRDFVAWLDEWHSHRASGSKTDTRRESAGLTRKRPWDVNPLVLGAERTLNAVLGGLGIGVGIAVTVQQSHP